MIEVLVATLMIVLVLGSAASIEVMHLNSGSLAKHTIQANNFAEEAFSFVKLIRDKKLKSNPTLNSLADFHASDKAQCFDNPNNPSALIPDCSGEQIDLNGTRFTRKICILSDANSDCTAGSTTTVDLANVPGVPDVLNPTDPNKVLAFNGSSSYVKINDYPKATNTLTVSAWVNVKAFPASWSTFVKNWGDSTRGQFQLGIYNTSQKASFFIAAGGSGTEYSSIDSVVLPLNSWQHIVGVADGANVRLYRNGVSVGATTPTYPPPLYSSTVQCLIFGAKFNNNCTAPVPTASRPGYLNGSLDDIRIYNRALSASEVSDLYNNRTVSNTNLVGWWKMDEGSGPTTTDTVSGIIGNLTNTSWQQDRGAMDPHTTLQIKINTNSNPDTVQYVIKELSVSDKFLQANGTLGTTEVWQTYAQWGGINGITNINLSPGVTYKYQVKAKNTSGTETIYSDVKEISTIP